jgi:chaperonin GroES
VVVAVGPGKDLAKGGRRPLGVAPGDRVFFARYAGAPVMHNGEELQLVREDNILAVIE